MIMPLASTGQTQITGYNASNAVVFTQTIPIPPLGSGASDAPTRQAVLQADALLAVSLGYEQANALPECSSSGSPCLAPNPGGGRGVHGLDYEQLRGPEHARKPAGESIFDYTESDSERSDRVRGST